MPVEKAGIEDPRGRRLGQTLSPERYCVCFADVGDVDVVFDDNDIDNARCNVIAHELNVYKATGE